MKRIISLLLCLLMVFALFAGCGAEEATSAPAESAASETVEAAPEAPAEEASVAEASVVEEVVEEPAEPAHVLPLTEDEVVFELFTGMNPNLMTYIDTYAETGIIRYLTEVTGVTVEIPAVHPATEPEKWTLMMASGDYPDFVGSLGNYNGGAQGAIDDEIVYDLKEFEEYMPYFFDLLAEDEALAKDCTLDSGSIATTYRVITGDYYVYDSGPMMRKDWLDALNLEVPTTYDEYYEVLKAFKSEYDATMWMSGSRTSTLSYGFNIRAGYSFGWTSSLDCFYVVDDQIQCGFYAPEFKDYLELMQKWMGEGLIDKDFAMTSAEYVNSDNTAFSAITSNEHGVWKEEANGMNAYEGYDMELVAAPYARHNADDIISVDAGKTRVDGSQYAISTCCEEPELAAEWLDMWYAPESTVVANWGIEGEGHELDENGNPYYSELVTNNPDGLSMGFARDMYAAPTGGYLYDMQTKYILWSDDAKAFCDTWATGMDGAYGMPSYMALTTEESEESSQLSGDLITYVSETLSKLILGELNLEGDLDTFVSTIKEMGMDRVIELQQAAYDRYQNR